MDDILRNSKIPEEKPHYADASIKQIIASELVQEAIRKSVTGHENHVVIKKVKKPYTNDKTNIKTQKVEAVSGTSIMDMITVNFTLVNTEIDAVESINKTYRLVDYELALEAKMSDKKFDGYSATGFKLMVTKIEEVKGDTDAKSKN